MSETCQEELLYARAKCLIRRKRSGDLSKLEMLLTEYPALVNAYDTKGRSLLHVVARYFPSANYIDALLDRNSSLLFKVDNFGYRPSLYTCERVVGCNDNIVLRHFLDKMSDSHRTRPNGFLEYWLHQCYCALSHTGNQSSCSDFDSALLNLVKFCANLNSDEIESAFVKNVLEVKKISSIQNYFDSSGRSYLMRYLLCNRSWPSHMLTKLGDIDYQMSALDFQGYSVHFFAVIHCSTFLDAYSKGVFIDTEIANTSMLGVTLLEYALQRHYKCCPRVLCMMIENGHHFRSDKGDTDNDVDNCDMVCLNFSIHTSLDIFLYLVFFNVVSTAKSYHNFIENCHFDEEFGEIVDFVSKNIMCDILPLSVHQEGSNDYDYDREILVKQPLPMIASLQCLCRYRIRSVLKSFSNNYMDIFDTFGLPLTVEHFLKLSDLRHFLFLKNKQYFSFFLSATSKYF